MFCILIPVPEFFQQFYPSDRIVAMYFNKVCSVCMSSVLLACTGTAT